MAYVVSYTVTDKSLFQAIIDADDEQEALYEWHLMVNDSGGDWTAPGTWIASEGNDVDQDSIRAVKMDVSETIR